MKKFNNDCTVRFVPLDSVKIRGNFDYAVVVDNVDLHVAEDELIANSVNYLSKNIFNHLSVDVAEDAEQCVTIENKKKSVEFGIELSTEE